MVRNLLIAALLLGCGRSPLAGGDDDDQGVCGDERFAVDVVEYDPAFSDGPLPSRAQFTDPYEALGEPDYAEGSDGAGHGAVSLGGGGLLWVSFGSCFVSNSGDRDADIRVYEVGVNVESTSIALVPTEATALRLSDTAIAGQGGGIFVGDIEGSTREVDIDAELAGFAAGELTFVSLVMVDQLSQGWTNSEWAGADIDAVELLAPRATKDRSSSSGTD
ncbi:MAG TPA: hypothetical protein VG755_38695 [Nannocystaceae bacterium]|nr:hypothetical protein [Nannocystaceae bacterium]